MSKTVTIPRIGGDPFVVRVGGQVYRYTAGSVQTVPDAVADVIENIIRLTPKKDPDIDDKQLITRGEVKKMFAEQAARSEEFKVKADATVAENVISMTNIDKTPAEMAAAVDAEKTIVLTANVAIAENITVPVKFLLSQCVLEQYFFNTVTAVEETEISLASVVLAGHGDYWEAEGEVIKIPRENKSVYYVYVDLELVYDEDPENPEIVLTPVTSFADAKAAYLAGKHLILCANATAPTGGPIVSKETRLQLTDAVNETDPLGFIFSGVLETAGSTSHPEVEFGMFVFTTSGYEMNSVPIVLDNE